MIVVDTSGLMAVVLDQAQAEACIDVLQREDDILIAAGTLTEALIVAARRQVAAMMRQLIEGLGMQVVPLTLAAAERSADAYIRWGRGMHHAGLNFGDCFAYSLARHRRCKLLFVGDDFSRTDVEACLPPVTTESRASAP